MDELITFRSLWKNYRILFLFVAIKMVLQLIVVNPVYELHRDEFLHLDQANHLAAGYISVPPLTSWVSVLIKLLGNSVFWVRFFPALFGACTLVVIWLIVEQLKGGLPAKITAATIFIFSVYARINILYQPNSFDILAWTCVYYFLIRFIDTNGPVYLYLIALSFVFGFYNKYNIVFLLAGLFGAMMMTGLRKIFLNRSFYLALALSFILILPNLIWQFNHQFPVIDHMRVLKETQLNNMGHIDFLKDQLLILGGTLPLIIAAFLGIFGSQTYRKYRVIGYSFLIVMAMFTSLKAKNYYALGLYPVFFAMGSVYLEKVLTRRFKIIAPVYIGLNLVLFIAIAKLLFPLLGPDKILARKQQFETVGLLRWEDGKNHHLPQDFADMLGWKEMADKALGAYNLLSEDAKRETLIFCDNYGQVGALNFYNRGKMAEAYSFNTDYLFWIPSTMKIKNVLLVGNAPPESVQQLFEHVEKIGMVEDQNAREQGTSIFLLIGAKKGFSEFFNGEINRRKLDMDCF